MTDSYSLLEQLLDDYLCWREQSDALDAAYRRWVRASETDRPVAVAAFVGQLEQERDAAFRYRRSAGSATSALADQRLAPVA